MKDLKKSAAVSSQKDEKDSKALVKSAFQWVYAVIWILFAFVFFFTVIFKVVSFTVRNGDNRQNVGVIISSVQQYTLKSGDTVAVTINDINCAREIIACEGESISVGIGKSGLVDCIIYKDRSFFSTEELESELKDLEVPKGSVLLKGSISGNEYFRVGQIVSEEQIIGKIDCIVYPFSMLGKPIQEITKV